MSEEIPETEEEWKEKLSEEQYRILREEGTEPRFSGDLLEVDDDGVFRCAGCGQALFDSDTKFDSETGWPSFWDAIDGSVELENDSSLGMNRTEVVCSKCGGHLGHVFDDGPQDKTRKRFCINSAALEFEEGED
jgi:peptide-methionine (R)-S-oxide reductase